MGQIILGRNIDIKAFDEQIETLRTMQGKKSGMAVIYEAIRFYVEEKPKFEKSNQELWAKLETSQSENREITKAIDEYMLAHSALVDISNSL